MASARTCGHKTNVPILTVIERSSQSSPTSVKGRIWTLNEYDDADDMLNRWKIAMVWTCKKIGRGGGIEEG